MKKSVKNRDVFIKLMLISVVISLTIATLVGLVSCSKPLYESNSITIQFDEKQAVFTIPKDCAIRVEKQTKYYQFEVLTELKRKEMDDLVQYVYDNRDSSNKIFRIEKDGFITKAGYFADSGNYKIRLDKSQNVYERKEYNGALPNGLTGIEDLILTNVGDNYFKTLQVGEEFDLRLFRNNMIINNPTSNLEIEPNFDLVLNGNSVKYEKVRENIYKILAVKNGITTIKVKYQAIEVLNKDSLFCYNASNEKREIVLTFAVGENYTTDIAFKIDGKDFDSEFDTCYFEKEYGTFVLQAEGVDKVICNDDILNANNSEYPLKIVEGANSITLKKGDKTRILTIYGAKISVLVEKSQDKISPQDEIKIIVQGLYNTLPKMSGIYNPTQKYDNGDSPTNGSCLQLYYINNNIKTVVANAKYVSQYYYTKNNELQFVVQEEYFNNNELIFDMAFLVEWWGSDLGVHRNINDNGIPVNLDAKLNSRNLGFFEKLKIQ